MKNFLLISLALFSFLFIPLSHSSASDHNPDSDLTEIEVAKLIRVWYDESTRTIHIRGKFEGREQELHVQVANARGQFVAEETFIIDRDNFEFELDLNLISNGKYRARAFSTTAYGATYFSVR